MSSLTTEKMVGIGAGVLVVTLAGIGGVFYNKHKDSEAAEQKQIGLAVAAAEPITQKVYNSKSQIKFAIGKYHAKYGKKWRKATAADWTNPAFQAALVQAHQAGLLEEPLEKAHQAGKGWALLEEPLVCSDVLFVAEGRVQIDGAYVVEVGFNGSQRLRGVYPAMNKKTQVAWTTEAPVLSNNWTVEQVSKQSTLYINAPCLFVKYAADAASARVFYKKNMDSEAADHSIKFAIGKYHNDDTYDKGWRMATAADWVNPKFQAKLVQAHQAGGGWALLEEPLVCDNVLYVAEGPVRIDGAYVIEVGHNWSESQELRGVYPAMNHRTDVAWTTTEPALGNTWTVVQVSTYDNVPCLFVRDLPESGGKKTRRRKGSRKQKRGTRKH